MVIDPAGVCWHIGQNTSGFRPSAFDPYAYLDFASRQLGKATTAMRLADIRSELILAFLDHLEQGRKNGIRSRNLRLTTLRAFLKFAS